MKKATIVISIILCLMLSACGAKLPEKAADGTAWEDSWTTIGGFLGVEPMEGWDILRNEDVLAAEGIFYTAWSYGASYTDTKESGDEITIYDGQIHLVLQEADSPKEAESTLQEWKALVAEHYPDGEVTPLEYLGESDTVTTYALSEDSRGASVAFVRGNHAIQVDVVTLNGTHLEPTEVLAEFLSRCHYAQ